jgi:hypothetical protein
MTARLLAAAVVAAIIGTGSLGAQNATPGRVSPPQPLQTQGLEYFEGAWSFTWTGRESPVSPGPRSGVVTFTRAGAGGPITIAASGTSEAGGAYKESGSMAWDTGKKTLTVKEKLAGGLELTSTGDWSSPISIRFESAPVKAGGQTIRLRRTYGIVSAHSFTVAEELSTDGGPFVRSGGGVFSRK